MMFAKSSNTQAFLKAGIMGFAGSGKTRTASEIAIGLYKILRDRKLLGGQHPVNFLDTETGSDWVDPLFRSQGIELFAAKTRAFKDLIPAVRETEKLRGILIIDSITHFWRELTETYAEERHRKRGLEFQDWAWLKKKWGEFTDAFVNSNCHIVMCGRAGYEYDFFQDDDGKKQLEKTGIKMKAETETGYEPSMLILMERHQDISTDPVTVWRTATILKDRAAILDGKQFRNPTFAQFKPHIDFLNLGGNQLGVDTDRNSANLIDKPDNGWQYERQQCEITLDEIKELLVKHYPSTSAAEKKAKGDLLETHFGSRSWERISTFPLNDLRASYEKLLGALEPKPAEPEPFGNPTEDDENAQLAADAEATKAAEILPAAVPPEEKKPTDAYNILLQECVDAQDSPEEIKAGVRTRISKRIKDPDKQKALLNVLDSEPAGVA